jgi:hypothetical protein
VSHHSRFMITNLWIEKSVWRLAIERRHDHCRRANHAPSPRQSQHVKGAPASVPDTVIENAIARGLLAAEDRAKPWPVIQGCYAAQLSDAALDWLVNGGVIAHEQRGDAGAILRSINKTRGRFFAVSIIGWSVRRRKYVRWCIPRGFSGKGSNKFALPPSRIFP